MVGWSHAVEQDVVMLTQEHEVPFDIRTQRVIMYSTDEGGLNKLRQNLMRELGISATK